MRRWHENHPEHKREEYQRNKATYQASQLAWREAHPERKREMDKAWREQNAERKNATDRAYYGANREEVLAKERARHAANPEPNQRKAREWAVAFPERAKAIWDRWHKNNPDKVKAATYANRAKRAAAPGSFTSEEWLAKQAEYGYRCAYCWAEGELTVDHVIPVTKSGSHAIDNIVPACGSCNNRKKARTPEQWAKALRSLERLPGLSIFLERKKGD
jgi:5-methylcytosine-specific restriction endonuclease McrA